MEHIHTLWLNDPVTAFARWQERLAVGADRRPFAAQSIVQHQAMFDRVYRDVVGRGQSLATVGADHVDAFLSAGDGFADDTATRIRYAKLLDRLFRYLVEIGFRTENPMFDVVKHMCWPEGDPVPAYLREAEDLALQEHVGPRPGDELRAVRNRAIVATFLGTGVTATEFQHLCVDDVVLASPEPYVSVAAHGPRDARTVHIEPFAVKAIEAWLSSRRPMESTSALLYPSKDARPLTVATLGNVVREALLAIGVTAIDMSPRLLRNTDCRRRLIAGHSVDEVTYRLGLASNRTVHRMLATLDDEPSMIA